MNQALNLKNKEILSNMISIIGSPKRFNGLERRRALITLAQLIVNGSLANLAEEDQSLIPAIIDSCLLNFEADDGEVLNEYCIHMITSLLGIYKDCSNLGNQLLKLCEFHMIKKNSHFLKWSKLLHSLVCNCNFNFKQINDNVASTFKNTLSVIITGEIRERNIDPLDEYLKLQMSLQVLCTIILNRMSSNGDISPQFKGFEFVLELILRYFAFAVSLSSDGCQTHFNFLKVKIGHLLNTDNNINNESKAGNYLHF